MKLTETIGGVDADAPAGRMATVYWPAATGM